MTSHLDFNDPTDLPDLPAYYDRQGRRMTLEEWGRAYEDYEGRVIARTNVGDVRVITVWTGFDGDTDFPPLQPPRIFGSIIKYGISFSHEIQTPTEESALAAHQELIDLVRSGEYLTDGRVDDDAFDA